MSIKRTTHIKRDDPIMLKQQILHYKAELARHEAKLKDYQNNYHYSMIESLKNENERLKGELDNLMKISGEREHQLKEENILLTKQLAILKDEKQEIELNLKNEIESLKKDIREYNENGEKIIKELLAEKEEYMEKWELLRGEFEHVKKLQALQKEKINDEQKQETEGTSWFTHNLNSLKRND